MPNQTKIVIRKSDLYPRPRPRCSLRSILFLILASLLLVDLLDQLRALGFVSLRRRVHHDFPLAHELGLMFVILKPISHLFRLALLQILDILINSISSLNDNSVGLLLLTVTVNAAKGLQLRRVLPLVVDDDEAVGAGEVETFLADAR